MASTWILAVLAILSCAAAQNCPVPDPLTHVVFLPHPTDCNKFYMCSNGVPIEQKCPGDLHFNPIANVCDYPASANCDANNKPPPCDAPLVPHPTDCTKFYSCDNGILIEQNCPTGLHFNPILLNCDWQDDAKCVVDINTQPPSPPPPPPCDSPLVPHPTDCTKFYSCDNGILIEQKCPTGLHFNAILLNCDWQEDADCEVGCEKLDGTATGTWVPSSCSSSHSDIGASCSLQCEKDYVLKGSAYIHCTEDGWSSSNGDFIPKCVPKECIGEDLENELNKTLSVDASLLFVLDESGSVGLSNFQKTKDFVKDVIAAFPLSATRSSGVITFASNSLVPVPLTISDTSDFKRRVDNIVYRTGGTNILGALDTAFSVIKSQEIHPLTLVFLITDGESQTDGTTAADKIKEAEYPLFTIGIGSTRLVHLEELSSAGANGIKHFFHFQDYDLLQSIGEYLNPSNGNQGSGNSTQCSIP